MRNAEDCRQKARECLLSAEQALSPDGRLHWHDLSNLWLTMAEERASYEKQPLARAPTRRPVDLAKPRVLKAVGMADSLRERLDLRSQERET
jgi:hypothetical protein